MNELVRRHDVRALAIVMKCGFKRADAEPIVAEAYLAVVKKWKRDKSLEEPENLLFATVRRRISNEFRRQGRKPTSLFDNEEIVDAASSALRRASFVEDTITKNDIAEALLELPHRQRAVLVLRFLHDLTVEIVAELLGCKPGVVNYAQQTGLATMRKSRWLAGHAGTAEVHQ
ncbi:RNA polymerase sigma factor [Amycolatopsis kentuckyensis]|uniref:RNA polymerase sigma factor n=1 Tax=Amycolatopsis kentuckyensis TaxID=218823 RepID=UPI0035628D47